MGIFKILEVVCDNCQSGIDTFPNMTIPQAKQAVRNTGAIVQYDKTFCNQQCADAWWNKKTNGRLKAE